MNALKRVIKILRSYLWLAVGATISLLLLTGANALTPQLFRRGIDEGIAQKNLDVVLATGAMMVGVAIARGLFPVADAHYQ